MLKFSIFVYVLLVGTLVPAEVKMSNMFTSHMVLQRRQKIPIWGRGTPGEKIIVEFNGQIKTAKTDASGNWQTVFSPMQAGGPYEMTIKGHNSLVLKDIMIGDVWLCSGQSNMAMSLSRAKNRDQEIAAAKHPKMRLFTVSRHPASRPQTELKGHWTVCTPDTAKSFSAVAYFFGRDLLKKLDVPIGLIHSSWGGTPGEAWTPMETLKKTALCEPIVRRYEKIMKRYPQAKITYEKEVALQKKFSREIKLSGRYKDPGNKGFKAGLAGKKFDDSKWSKFRKRSAAFYWPGESVVWLRYTTTIPGSWMNKDLLIANFGIVGDLTIYFNGKKVGARHTAYNQRNYKVPKELVKSGKNVIAVRVYATKKAARFGAAPFLCLSGRSSVKQFIWRDWRYKTIASMSKKDVVISRPEPLSGPDSPRSPSTLYNGMINPIIPYPIKGVIWYQGEGNAYKAFQYRYLLKAMITSWRKKWNQGDFPFLIAQLANFKLPVKNPGNSQWAELREAQAMALELPDTGLAVLIDIGDAYDIHPKDKQTVGKRLALSAMKIAYRNNIVYSGPVFETVRFEGNKAIITFKNIGSGLLAKGGPLKSFAIADRNKKFVWANAEIENDTVIVSSPEIDQPYSVRYAWADNPDKCNLYNKEGLPAVPFRTDKWPGITDKNR
jgi:sialate O-acetylesterase